MSEIVADFATDAELQRWDAFVESSVNGTLFHRRRFLAYHGDKFSGQERFVVFRKGESCVALMSCAVSGERNEVLARSPYGGSYGGIVLGDLPSYSEAAGIARALVDLLTREGIDRLVLVPPLACCSTTPLDTFTFSLLEQGFRSVNRDVSSVLDLRLAEDASSLVTGRARNMARKAKAADVVVMPNAALDAFWPLMTETFARHGTKATHSRDDLAWLLDQMPERVSIDVATIGNEAVAGTLIFRVNARVSTTFYFCQNEAGQSSQALSLIVCELIDRLKQSGVHYLDFGTSTYGMTPRPNIFRFKESFGAFGQFRETFEYRRAA